MRTIIAGSRTFADADLLAKTMAALPWTPTVVLSGGARGADRLGEQWARRHSIPVEVYPADWNTYGRSAGYRRNEVMAGLADALVAFWDGTSPGTKHMLDIARSHGLRYHLVTPS